MGTWDARKAASFHRRRLASHLAQRRRQSAFAMWLDRPAASTCPRTFRSAPGLTLIELLVILAILGIALVLLLPTLTVMRESSRRLHCEDRIRKLAAAVHRYQLANDVYPPGVQNPSGPIHHQPTGIHQGWIGQVLPYLGYEDLYGRLDAELSVYAPENEPVRSETIVELLCPSDKQEVGQWPSSNYAGNHHHVEAPIDESNQGVLFLNSMIRPEDIVDGDQFTLLLGEKLREPSDLGWLSGTRSTLRNTGTPLSPSPQKRSGRGSNGGQDTALEGRQDSSDAQEDENNRDGAGAEELFVGGYSSAHPAGAHAGFCDGSVRLMSYATDPLVWQQMGNRADSASTPEAVRDE